MTCEITFVSLFFEMWIIIQINVKTCMFWYSAFPLTSLKYFGNGLYKLVKFNRNEIFNYCRILWDWGHGNSGDFDISFQLHYNLFFCISLSLLWLDSVHNKTHLKDIFNNLAVQKIRHIKYKSVLWF